jgi:hypothetical protein
MAALLVSFAATRFDPLGWSTVFAVFLACEAIDGLRRQPPAFHTRTLVLLGVLGIVVALHGISQMLRGGPAIAHLDNTNTMGAFLAMASPAAGIVGLPPLALWPVALWGAGSLTGALAFLAAGLVVLAVGGWRVVALVLPCAVALGATFVAFAHPNLHSVVARLGVWTYTLRASRDAWLVGHGPGSFSALGLHQPDAPVWAQAHHELIQWGYETGVLGVVTVLGYLATQGLGLWRVRRDPRVLAVAAMLTAFVVASMGHFVARLATTAAVGIVAFGMSEALIAQGEAADAG